MKYYKFLASDLTPPFAYIHLQRQPAKRRGWQPIIDNPEGCVRGYHLWSNPRFGIIYSMEHKASAQDLRLFEVEPMGVPVESKAELDHRLKPGRKFVCSSYRIIREIKGDDFRRITGYTQRL